MLKEYENKYDNIMDSSLDIEDKNYELSKLMTNMETDFEIPRLNNNEWNNKNKEVIELYRIISNSRSL